MNIDLTEYTSLENMNPGNHMVLVTNGIDLELAWATMQHDSEKREWTTHFDKTLPNGEITHWRYV